MTVAVIITICVLILLAYIFDITASRTKIPSIILLLILGFALKQITFLAGFQLPNLNPILPILGTIGLILIVLEGTLELDINRSKLKLIGTTLVLALVPMIILSFALAYSLLYAFDFSLKYALTNAIPLCIISSAIAIPSSRFLKSSDKEFVTYESSLSDIIGVIFFNFITLNEYIRTISFGIFLVELIIMFIVSFFATIALAFLIAKIKHHFKFVPIIILVVLIYTISKLFNLPALIFILLFGLIVQNLDEMKGFKFIQRLNPDILDKEVHKFSEITTEFSFLIRALFFILFGYLIQFEDIINLETLPWAGGIVIAIFLIRAVFLKLLKLRISPLLYIAPRGLITILLFLSIPVNQKILIVNNALLIQVIIICAIIMMFGLMFSRETASEPIYTKEEDKDFEKESLFDVV
ncbi:MAG: cation:proton antiporter [Bacteroidetes bacterium]|nr:cation:proton antiporter [Bacteroidota bacterium]